MSDQPPVGYRHKQTGPWFFLLFAVGVGMLTLAWFLRELPALPIILGVAGGVVLLLAPAFHHLTVVDEGDRLAIRFGWLPLFQRRIPYQDMQAVEVGQTTLLDGWGVHWSLKGGWVWNIWGWECVVIRHGLTTFVGTNDAENLAGFLRTKIPNARE